MIAPFIWFASQPTTLPHRNRETMFSVGVYGGEDRRVERQGE